MLNKILIILIIISVIIIMIMIYMIILQHKAGLVRNVYHKPSMHTHHPMQLFAQVRYLHVA